MKFLRAVALFLGLALALGAAEADFKKGDRVEAKSYSSWYPATIIDTRPGEWKVTYDGYSSGSDEWVGLDRLRRKGEPAPSSLPKPAGPAIAGQWKAGDRVEAQSYGAWYPATVLAADGAKWKVTYDGYSSGSDEWLPAEKIRPIRTASWKVGDRVEGLSYGKWYAGKIVEVEASRWKIDYDEFSGDEWLRIDSLRAPGAKTQGGSDQNGQAVEKHAFPVRPAGAQAGLEGAFLRVETYYWGSRLSLSNQGWFFTKEGRFSREPEGGFAFKELAATNAPRKTDGIYWIKDGKITFAFADGSKPEEHDFENKGDEVRWGGLGVTRVKGFRKGWRFAGEYEGGASLGGGTAASTTVVFRPDGTFALSSVGTASSTSAGTTVSGGAQGAAAGTYEFDGHTLTLVHTGGDPQTFTVLAFGGDDAAGRPLYIYREGTMMKRQDRK